MLDQLFGGLFDTTTTTVIPVYQFMLCIAVALIAGVLLASIYTYRSQYNASFVRVLAIMPAVVCVVIMMVNGNVGAGVAVAGAFSLVRFRSVPGTAKEIGAIFIAMGAGLIVGMGYLAYGILFTLILSVMIFLYTKLNIWEPRSKHRTMIITIPEDLDYTHVFDDLLEEYTVKNELKHVKTTNMGSLFKLTYDLELKDQRSEKELIDQLRCRNGNLEIVMTNQETMSLTL